MTEEMKLKQENTDNEVSVKKGNKPKSILQTVFKTKNLISVLSLIVAIFSVIANVVITYINKDAVLESTKFEVTFNEQKKLFTNQLRLLYALDNNIKSIDYHYTQGLMDFEKVHPLLKRNMTKQEYYFKNMDSFNNISKDIATNISDLKLNTIEIYPYINKKRYRLESYVDNLDAHFINYRVITNTLIINNNNDTDMLKYQKESFEIVTTDINNCINFVGDTVYAELFQNGDFLK